MNYSVIRVLKTENGQNCAEEFKLDNKYDAEYIAATLNKGYGTANLKWVIDEYPAVA